MSSTHFDFDAGALALDFANTVDWHASDSPTDRLSDYADLLRWGEAAGILTTDRRRALERAAQQAPEQAAAAFARAINLREAIYRIFASRAEGQESSANDLTILNAALSESLLHLHVKAAAGGFVWEWATGPAQVDAVRWPVARSAAELLTGADLDRVGQCADDRGCGYLFLDVSRNRSRRWCSMEACGNRAKARRHYRRQQNQA